MARPRAWLTGLVCLAGLTWASGENARAQAPVRVAATGAEKMDKTKAAALVPLQDLPERYRENVRTTIEKPALFTQGPVETFACAPQVYYWLVAHPDRGVIAWRRLGAQCITVNERGPGRFGWSDEHGSDLQWETVYDSNDRHIWYAEGKVRPAPLLPLVPVKAVVSLRYTEQPGPNGATLMQQQADMFLHTDSVGAALATKLLGAAAPKMAEQCVTQMQMFFSSLAWYIYRHPDRAAVLLMPSGPTDAPMPAMKGTGN